MDVHAPHHPLHTWKDFWIHLGTITIGLLIALGLENAAEHAHQLHQRHQLLEDLHREGESNRQIVANDIEQLIKMKAWFQASMQELQKAERNAGHAEVALPPEPQTDILLIPLSGAWDTATSSGMLQLLPRPTAETYSQLYLQNEWIKPQVVAFIQDGDDWTVLQEEYWGGSKQGVALNAEQIQRLEGLDRKMLSNLTQMVETLQFYDGINRAILGGANSEQELIEKMK